MQLEDQLILFLGPLVLLDVWVQVVVPSKRAKNTKS